MTRDEWLGAQHKLALVDELVRELIGICEAAGLDAGQQAQLWDTHKAIAQSLDEAAAVIGGTP